MNLNAWAQRHGIPHVALYELYQVLGTVNPTVERRADTPDGEDHVQSATLLRASQLGLLLWRNNVGVLPDKNGRPVRFGLANDSARVNKQLKSSDLIGATPYLVQPADVGRLLGVFTALETKRRDWRYSGTSHEQAQLNYLNLVRSRGGVGAFINDETQLDGLIK